MAEKRLLLVVNEDRFFLSHRKEIALRALEKGWDVTIVAKNTGKKDEVEAFGLRFIEMPVNPTGKKLHQEFRTLKFLYDLYGKHQGAIIHHVGLKNIAWGSVAARLRHAAGVINAVSGLGYIFSEFNPSKIKNLLIPVLRWGMATDNVTLIYQNKDDMALFRNNKIGKKSKTYRIKGSGVDLTQFYHQKKEESSPLRVIFAARMVKDKGVLDFIKAAELLRPKYEGKVEFVLCGSLSSNPYAVTENELNCLCDGKYIKWLGFRDDMPEQYAQSDIMCFPSYYREGVPKAIIDASAASLPIVTCDSVGCRDAVEEGVNGFKVPPQSPEKLAEKLELLLNDREMREGMGEASRQKAEKEYDVRKVVETHISIYEQSLKKSKKKK